MGPLGVQEMIAIFVIALLLFGPKKLPELGRLLGKGLREFRRAKSELTATFESHLSELEKEVRTDTNSTHNSGVTTAYTPSSYSYPYDENGSYDSGVQISSPDTTEAPSGAVARGSVAATPSSDPTPVKEEHTV